MERVGSTRSWGQGPNPAKYLHTISPTLAWNDFCAIMYRRTYIVKASNLLQIILRHAVVSYGKQKRRFTSIIYLQRTQKCCILNVQILYGQLQFSFKGTTEPLYWSARLTSSQERISGRVGYKKNVCMVTRTIIVRTCDNLWVTSGFYKSIRPFTASG